MIQGHKKWDNGYTSYGDFLTAAGGVLQTQHLTSPRKSHSMVEGHGRCSQSANGLSSSTSPLTASIHTVDPLNVPYNGITLNPGQSVQSSCGIPFR